MPQLPILKISEIFFSVEGEGLRQGEPTIFVRLSGCNLRCHFCDTKYAWKGGQKIWEELIISKIVGIRKKYMTTWVCLTGGEPLLQNLKSLVLKLRKAGFKIQIETNGTQPVPYKLNWLTVSPKPPAFYATPDCRRKADEVKLIVTRSLKLKDIIKVRKDFAKRIPVTLQPESNARWSYEKASRLWKEAIRAGVVNIRLSCQLHKIYRLK
jgi:organic radical activating enzyme